MGQRRGAAAHWLLTSATCCAALVASACGGGGGGTAHSTTSAGAAAQATTAATRASTSAAASPPSSAPTSTLLAPTVDLSKQVIAAPDGYSVSTSADAHNGPVSPVDFDHLVGSTGSAASLGFVAGYDETFDSNDSLSSDSIDITLFRFSSAATASNL